MANFLQFQLWKLGTGAYYDVSQSTTVSAGVFGGGSFLNFIINMNASTPFFKHQSGFASSLTDVSAGLCDITYAGTLWTTHPPVLIGTATEDVNVPTSSNSGAGIPTIYHDRTISTTVIPLHVTNGGGDTGLDVYDFRGALFTDGNIDNNLS